MSDQGQVDRDPFVFYSHTPAAAGDNGQADLARGGGRRAR